MSDKQVRAQYTREFKQEAVRQVRSGQAIAVVAKAPMATPNCSTYGRSNCSRQDGRIMTIRA